MIFKTYHYERVEDKEVEVFIPENIFYCFQTGIRRSIRIVPIFTTELKIYKLEITCVYLSGECIIEKFRVNISDIGNYLKHEDKSKECGIVQMLLNEDYYERNEENFDFDLQEAINKILIIEKQK